MRVMVDVATSATELPWHKVTTPGRGLLYELMRHAAPRLGAMLHEHGWGPHQMVPMGYGAPLFPFAARRRGVYAAGGPGLVEFGSPWGGVAEVLAEEISRREVLSWGGVELRVMRVGVLEPPPFASGQARMRTRTPVVIKGRDEKGERAEKESWVLPNEPPFRSSFTRNLVHKAQTLGLPSEVSLESIIKVGPKRSFAVGQGAKPGATVEVELHGDPDLLRALWSWGLGEANSAGFGWVDAGISYR